jgi:hypothetical protein
MKHEMATEPSGDRGVVGGFFDGIVWFQITLDDLASSHLRRTEKPGLTANRLSKKSPEFGQDFGQIFGQQFGQTRLAVCSLLLTTSDYPQGDSNPLSISRKGKPHKEVTENASEFAAHSLARETQIDPDLARLIDAWPTLPPPVKRMILAALECESPCSDG